ncbi:piggybac transposable element-derived protein 4-like protein, partial [Lasius niger]
MSYYRKKCVVLGCESQDLRLRSFPLAKDKERFLKWLRACGNIELLQLSEGQLRHRVVCDRHFEARVKLATTLSRVAVPTLHLPKPIDTSNYKFTEAQTIVAPKTSDNNSTNDEIAKTLAELSESDVGGSEDEVSEEEHILDAEQRRGDVEQDAEFLSDSSDPGDRAAFNYSTEAAYVGRNKITTWKKTPCTSQSATMPSEKEDITRPSHSVANEEYEIADELSAFREIFDDGMLEEIVACTNFSIERKHRACSSHRNMKETTRAEMLAVIGLLYLAGMKRASHASLLELRFLFLLDCLQLDDRNTRATRLKVDKLAPVRNIWNMFVENCKNSYLPSESLAVGDRLKNFRGKCSFVQHDSNKLARCGLKIISLVDAKTSFTCNMELYCDQQPEGSYRVSNDPAAIVQRLIEHLKGSNYNLTCDEHYTSYLLAVSLLADKITFLGAMGRDHREVPLCFLPGKSRPVGSTRLGFRNDATLASHVPQKGKAVIVLSTAHHDAKFNPWTKKPMIIEHYDAAKDAMDVVERTCAIYSVSKKTKRWPLTVFFVLLDVAGVNAQILYNASQTKLLQ